MTLRSTVALHLLASEFFEYSQLTPIPTSHPPSLKNPKKVKVPSDLDTWHHGNSKAARKKAAQDVNDIMQRTRRQIGRPTIAHVAPMPVFPSIVDWT